MKNIGIIRFNEGDMGGIEYQIINIVSNLDSTFFKFILITNKSTKFSKKFEKYGEVCYINKEHLLKSVRELKKFVKEKNISIIQSHMLREHYIGCLTKLKIKDLYHIFRVHTYINCSFISNLKKRLYHLLTFLLQKNVDVYLPINKKNYEELVNISKIKSNKVKIVHDGVKKIGNLKNEEFNYEELIMIANFNYGKGHDIALRALRILVNKSPEYSITFVGENNKTEENKLILRETQELARELKIEKNVKFIGFVEDIEGVLKGKSIIILPSYNEGTPNCLLEAMSSKKIVIASCVGGIPEFIEDGRNGFLHENKDYETLAKKILKLKEISCPNLKNIKEEGYKTWEKGYSVSKLCQELKSIYEKKGKNEIYE